MISKKSLIDALIKKGCIKKEFKKIEKIHITHGICCQCKTCGRYHDECVCEHNEWIDFVNEIIGENMDWKESLKNKFELAAQKKIAIENAIKEKEEKFKEFSKNVIVPAFEEIEQELIKYNRKVKMDCNDYSCYLYVMYSTNIAECTFWIEPLPHMNEKDCELCFKCSGDDTYSFIPFNTTKEEIIKIFVDLYCIE